MHFEYLITRMETITVEVEYVARSTVDPTADGFDQDAHTEILYKVSEKKAGTIDAGTFRTPYSISKEVD